MTYATESVDGVPYLLARLRWPDLAEVISPHRPEWHEDRNQFRMLYGSDGAWISEDDAR